jgi:Sugar-specific transcriptional regulator TrmB
VFDSRRDVKKTLEERRSERDRVVRPEHVRHVLRRVAFAVGKVTLLPHEYESGREALLTGRLDRTALALKRLLPTQGQIETASNGSWDRALEIAGLRPRSAKRTVTESVSIEDAIARFYARHGHLPQYAELEELAREAGFSLASKAGKSSRDWTSKGMTRISELGLPEPPSYGEVAHDAWKPIEISTPGLPTRRVREYTHAEVLRAVDAFLAALPAGATPIDKRWRDFSRGKKDVPSLGVIKRHGGVAELAKELARQDSGQDSNDQTDPHEPDIPSYSNDSSEPPRASATTRPELVREGQPARIYTVISLRGRATPGRVAETLGIRVAKVRAVLRGLVEAGLVEVVDARKEAYALVRR